MSQFDVVVEVKVKFVSLSIIFNTPAQTLYGAKGKAQEAREAR